MVVKEKIDLDTQVNKEYICFKNKTLQNYILYLEESTYVGNFLVVDPGFGQGGEQKNFPRFCLCSKVKPGEQSELISVGI